MVWKWEVWLCHKQPQWSRPQGIQMASTWTPLAAKLEAEQDRQRRWRRVRRRKQKDLVVWTEGMCVYIRVRVHQWPLELEFLNESLEWWCRFTKGKQGGEPRRPHDSLDHFWLPGSVKKSLKRQQSTQIAESLATSHHTCFASKALDFLVIRKSSQGLPKFFFGDRLLFHSFSLWSLDFLFVLFKPPTTNLQIIQA